MKYKCLFFLIITPYLLFSEQKNTIGSHLMKYFPHLLRNSLVDEEIPKLTIFKSGSALEIISFYRELPRKIKLTEEEREIIESLPEKIWEIEYHWNPGFWFENTDPHYLNYHRVVQSISKRIIKKALINIGYEKTVKHPVIHYRLGDVPFCRNKGHHISRYAYHLWALKKIPFNDDKTVIVVSSNHHHAKPNWEESSIKYLEDFLSFLRENGYHPLLQNETILDDFATLVFAPALVGSSSSFAFMAGLANDGIVLFPLIGREAGKEFRTIKNCEWMYPYRPLLHKQIRDFHDKEKVFAKLREDQS